MLEFIYRRMKLVVVAVATLFVASLFVTTLTDVLSTAMPVVSFLLLLALIFSLGMALLVGEEYEAAIEDEDFTHHDSLPEYVYDDEDHDRDDGRDDGRRS